MKNVEKNHTPVEAQESAEVDTLDRFYELYRSSCLYVKATTWVMTATDEVRSQDAERNAEALDTIHIRAKDAAALESEFGIAVQHPLLLRQDSLMGEMFHFSGHPLFLVKNRELFLTRVRAMLDEREDTNDHGITNVLLLLFKDIERTYHLYGDAFLDDNPNATPVRPEISEEHRLALVELSSLWEMIVSEQSKTALYELRRCMELYSAEDAGLVYALTLKLHSTMQELESDSFWGGFHGVKKVHFSIINLDRLVHKDFPSSAHLYIGVQELKQKYPAYLRKVIDKISADEIYFSNPEERAQLLAYCEENLNSLEKTELNNVN